MKDRLRIRDMREDSDLTQAQVAAHLGINQRTYSNYETEKRSLPIDHYRKLALLYHTSVDYLIGLTDEPRPYPRRK
ncbi:MAG: helix-turn-helix transcriptional regulator [Oscillospiraceae bacterium]|nr:helix-turn-helix transcriptional regulator [Oscillospiraceae bacterium]